MSLLNQFGRPIEHARPKKEQPPTAPRTAEFGQWAGRESFYVNLPGGGVMQFDLNQLGLADFRAMRSHYQLGASLNVLSFVMHQIDWKIECEDQSHADYIEEQIRAHWTSLIFALSQAFWAGFSPIAVNYANGPDNFILKRFKDLVPEECTINWKKTEGWKEPGKGTGPTLHSYDGLRQNGYLIPPENTIWYPLLMEGGDHWGRKLLKPAFPAWFFSNLIHLYANRYFERFGEPFPIGRAPFEDEILTSDGQVINGRKAMEEIVSNIRNRAVTVLPSDRDPEASSGSDNYMYDIEYLESQMRGADFERYLGRLDEEMSLSVFTPVLLFRTADVGSYNLGQAHMKIFEQMLNAIAGDAQFYIQNFLVDRLNQLCFPGGPRARWTYRRLGTVDLTVYKEIVVEIVRQGAAKLDLQELGALIGVSMEEVEQLTEDPDEPDKTDADGIPILASVKSARAVLSEAAARAANQATKGSAPVVLGYKNRVFEALIEDGFKTKDAKKMTTDLYAGVNTWLDDAAAAFEDSDQVKNALERVIDLQLESV